MFSPAVFQVDVTAGRAGFPMDLCQPHYAAAAVFFGAELQVVERY